MSLTQPFSLIEQALDPRPLRIAPDTPVLDAIALMSQNHTTYVLIDDAERLAGIFTERDVVRIAAESMVLEGIAIAQLMTQQPITLSIAENQDIFSVISILRSSGIRHLPVLNESGRVLGVITPQSLRQALNPADMLQMRHVRDIMIADVLTATATTPVLEIAQLMATRRKSCVVICQTDGNPTPPKLKPIGIITERDIVQFKILGLDLAQIPAATVMSSPLLPIDCNVSIWEAHQRMKQHRIRRLVVVDETGTLTGLVTQSNLLEALNPVDINNTIDLLQQTITERTQALKTANLQMQQEVQQRIEAESEVRRLNGELEQRVKERTAQLAASNEELKQTLVQLQATQTELIHCEKMAALGQLVAGIAHEVNTPLGAIRSSIDYITDFLAQNLKHLPQFFQTLPPERHADFLALLHTGTAQSLLNSREKRKLKRQIVGQLNTAAIANADTIADTLVDMGVYEQLDSFLPLLRDKRSEAILDAAYQLASLHKSANIITMATNQAAKVVYALKSYSHQNATPTKVRANIVDSIETVLTLYHNHLKHGVEIIRNYENNLPEIFCYPDELHQVWTNLIHNALQAMNSQGTIQIDARHQEGCLKIKITDSGSGISPEIQDKIFQPFFTTKALGEGSGLGLDIVTRILNKHGGKIDLESIPGQTTFIVDLPI
ncbi:CBS domain-containing protein [Lusitaniella coriacea]|uniref:CBS domain-containing protein n=1 Tax=Lusitaniella coriacea TaxID=1983105 RepID=UPI003CE837D3